MTTTVSKRNSRDDRLGDPKGSPFRAYKDMTRYKGAVDMINKRVLEIAALEKLLSRTSEIREQRRLTTRLLASKNNMRSWQDYLAQNYPHVKGSVIIP